MSFFLSFAHHLYLYLSNIYLLLIFLQAAGPRGRGPRPAGREVHYDVRGAVPPPLPGGRGGKGMQILLGV